MGKTDTIVGLDIGKFAVKAAWVRLRGGSPVVTRTEELRLPPEGTVATSLIASWAEQTGLQNTSCVVGIPGQQTMFQPFVLPPGDPRTEEQAASMEVIKFNEMASETMLYDLHPFEFNPEERRLLVAMARPTVVSQLISLSREIGVNVIDVIPSPVALFNALELASETHEEPTIYANVGHATTELAIGSALGLVFARSFSSGGRMFTEALARAGELAYSRAEELKVTESFVPHPDSSAATGEKRLSLKSASAQSPLTQTTDLWLSELESCISVYKSLFAEQRLQPTQLVLSGGASQLRGFREYVEIKTRLRTVHAESVPGSRKPEDATSYAVAIGLALSKLGVGPISISLLPSHLREELELRQQKPYWIAAAVAGGLVLTVSLVGGCRDLRRIKNELGAQRASLKRRQELVQQIEAIKAGTKQIRQMARPIRGLLHAAPLLRDLVTLVAETKDEDDQITMVCDADTYFKTNPLAPPEEGVGSGRRRIDYRLSRENAATNPVCERVIIEGFTKQSNLSTVKGLIASLKEAGYVESADLVSDDKLVGQDTRLVSRDMRRFVIEVRATVQ
jgi:Tfp pilus assembly PilM family ATPase